jgi:hypothetical protein
MLGWLKSAPSQLWSPSVTKSSQQSRLIRRLDQAHSDLAHVNATISIFEASGDRESTAAYVDIHRLFRRGELITICKAAFAEHGPMDTRALGVHILTAKGLDAGDRVLAKSVAGRIIHALRMQAPRGKIASGGKRNGVRVWGMFPPKT